MIPQRLGPGVSDGEIAPDLLILLASPAGFKPTTPGLGILCSILLSYGDLQMILTGCS